VQACVGRQTRNGVSEDVFQDIMDWAEANTSRSSMADTWTVSIPNGLRPKPTRLRAVRSFMQNAWNLSI
jgi:hypothetical protein